MSDEFDAAFNESKPVVQQEPVPEVVAAPEAPVTDVPAAPATGDIATPPVVEKKSEPIPIQALLDERDKRQKYEREAADLRAKLAEFETSKNSPPPDIYADPEARLNYERQLAQAAHVNSKLETSRFLAEDKFGKETVDAAFEYFNQHPELSHQFLDKPSPFHAAVEFYKRQKSAEEVGTDLDAYKARLRAEWEAEKAAQPVDATSPTQRLPGSLAAAPAAGKSEPPPAANGFESAFG